MEDIKDNFFNYTKAIVNFTYTFGWNVTKCSFKEISKNATSKKDIENPWIEEHLYNRPMCWTGKKKSSYHPNLVSHKLKVLHKQFIIDNELEITIPSIPSDNFTTKLNCTIRFNENGTGVCTFSAILDKKVTFKKIHLLLHLASTTKVSETHHKTHVYIKNKNDNECYPDKTTENIILTDLFNQIFENNSLPIIWRNKELNLDKSTVLDKEDEKFNDWQSPYTTTFLEVPEPEYKSFQDGQGKNKLKEITSIAGRLSLENDKIEEEFDKIKREYVYRSYGSYQIIHQDEKERKGIRIRNYSHHKDLFYTIDKRGAIAITPDLSNNPSYFVIPTLLNLVEILRSRWHIGSIVNLKLDELFENISENSNLSEIQEDIFICRKLYGLFLKDPTPYLFDGGAITEIAETGDKIFWLNKLSNEMEKKLFTIDKLINDIFSIQRYKNLNF